VKRPKILLQVTDDLEGTPSELERKTLLALFERYARNIQMINHSRDVTKRETSAYL
jgi:hypothetical protein